MKRFVLVSLLAATALSACSGSSVKETLGIDNRAPDEFRVVSRPPLSVPPQFSLRPPSVGDESANPNATDKQAESLITGKPAATSPGGETFLLKNPAADTAVQPVAVSPATQSGSTSAESQFLERAGANVADPAVRRTLAEEKLIKQEKQEEASWWEIWSTTPDKKETVVNAKEESERIKQTQDEGKPVNEGDTPVVKPRDRGVLGRILGD